jgi:hypothetical protein
VNESHPISWNGLAHICSADRIILTRESSPRKQKLGHFFRYSIQSPDLVVVARSGGISHLADKGSQNPPIMI